MLPLNITEKIAVTICEDSDSGSIIAAKEIADLIRRRSKSGKNTVLGLATGSSPIKVYEELVRMYREENLDFSSVITFNLDEYYNMLPQDTESYVYFMRHHLFNHVNIKPENIHIPDGTIPEDKIKDYCSQYEWAIEAAGGIDLQLLGIGRNGHIGFNEPGSQVYSKTRQITLDMRTKVDAAAAFGGLEYVPTKAITMGISTILKSRRIILLAWGENKADSVKQSVEGDIQEYVPATFLQKHNNVDFIIDSGAASKLSRTLVPWLFTKTCNWNERLIRKAVVWLSISLNKSILKLTDRDYIDHGLSELLDIYKSSYQLNIKLFNDLQHTITGWPGGKPNADDSQRPERALPYPKKVIVFSPHPDDDVISMGGTISRLVEQKHEVHIAYQTSGSIAVYDEDVRRYLDFLSETNEMFSIDNVKIADANHSLDEIREKNREIIDYSKDITYLKGAIRRSEAKAACRYIGVDLKNVHFLQMPFYESGKIKKHDLSNRDIQLIVDLLNEVKPHQIYAAGDLSDPHGTHRTCYNAIIAALELLKDEDWLKDCNVWLYRGAWQEWEVYEVDMAVPLSPDEVTIKRKAIFKHQSQKDDAPFPGSDNREFWQRAEERNHYTASLYDQLGLADYQAMEVFTKLKLPF